jgi:glycosyltransferase involved in cell wall biosynthesis
MKIDLLITEIFTGGAERLCAQLATYLHEKKHTVRVISIGPAPVGPTETLLLRQLERHSIEVEFLNASKSWQLPWARRKLRGLIDRSQPDIAQTILWHANLLGAWCYSKAQIPIVAGVRVAEPRRWRSRLAWSWRDRVEKVVCVSDEVAQWCLEHEHVGAEKLLVIPNGIELPVEWRDPLLQESSGRVDEKILLFVGRFELQKGIDILLENASRILEALPDHRLVLIGQGAWSSAWQDSLERSPFANRIELLGRRSDVMDWMRRSSLLLLPARYEGMPNVILEAMSVGLPVISTRVEGIHYLLGDTSEAQSVAAGDWESWVNRTIELAQDPVSLEKLGLANRLRAENLFDLESQLHQYELLYREILSKLSRNSKA